MSFGKLVCAPGVVEVGSLNTKQERRLLRGDTVENFVCRTTDRGEGTMHRSLLSLLDCPLDITALCMGGCDKFCIKRNVVSAKIDEEPCRCSGLYRRENL